MLASLLFFLSLSATRTIATTFYEQPFPEMVQESPVMVRGKIGASYTNWVEGQDRTKRIHTFYELQVDEVFKGNVPTGRTLIIRELGGVKEGIGMEVTGSARFERGEDAVITLGEANSDGSHNVHGMMMGKFSIEKDAEGQEYLVGAGMGHMLHKGGQNDPHESNRHRTDKTKWTLDALRSLIRTQAQSEKPSSPPAVGQSLPKKGDGATSPSQTMPLALSPAPQLQNISVEEEADSSSKGSGWIYYLLLGVVGIVAFFVLVVMKRPK